MQETDDKQTKQQQDKPHRPLLSGRIVKAYVILVSAIAAYFFIEIARETGVDEISDSMSYILLFSYAIPVAMALFAAKLLRAEFESEDQK